MKDIKVLNYIPMLSCVFQLLIDSSTILFPDIVLESPDTIAAIHAAISFGCRFFDDVHFELLLVKVIQNTAPFLIFITLLLFKKKWRWRESNPRPRNVCYTHCYMFGFSLIPPSDP